MASAHSQTLAHGMIGGVSSCMQGGKFGHGFAAAGFSKLATPAISKVPTAPAQITVAAMVGGTASRLSGGKFANGAASGAMVHAFGQIFQRRNGAISGRQGPGGSVEGEAPLSTGVIGRMAADGHGPPAPYATIEEAARAGIEIAASLSTSNEYGGAVVRVESGYYATSPVTIGEPRRFQFSLESGVDIAGIYHTHPVGPDSLLFSSHDIRQAQAHDVPSYIGFMERRSIRYFDPSQGRPNYRRQGAQRILDERGRELCLRCF